MRVNFLAYDEVKQDHGLAGSVWKVNAEKSL